MKMVYVVMYYADVLGVFDSEVSAHAWIGNDCNDNYEDYQIIPTIFWK